MAANHEELEERVAYLERELERKGVIIDHLQAQSNRHLGDINRHLSQQDASMQTMAQQIKAGFEEVAKQIAGLNKRHDFTDGQFAEVRADIEVLSNKVADIVKREGN